MNVSHNTSIFKGSGFWDWKGGILLLHLSWSACIMRHMLPLTDATAALYFRTLSDWTKAKAILYPIKSPRMSELMFVSEHSKRNSGETRSAITVLF